MQNLFTGQRVRLLAYDPDRGGELTAKWYGDSEFTRFYDMPAVMPKNAKRVQERERKREPDPNIVVFLIQTLAEPKLIGECELERNTLPLDEAFVAIGLGEREYWGRGYGTDAMRVLLRYAFCEWNVRRVALSVFAYNPRAIRSYEKLGFQHEGRRREAMRRSGERFDVLYMGVLRREWEAAQHG